MADVGRKSHPFARAGKLQRVASTTLALLVLTAV